MSKTSSEQNLEQRAALFKALGHPIRLLILNLVQASPRHGEELAAILKLNPATVSHHLGILTSAGLLKSEKDQYYQVYSLSGELLKKTIADVVRLPQPMMENQVQEDAFKAKVLRTFVKHGRITQIPTQLKKRMVLLEMLLESFEPGRDYPEREVNLILVEYHDDVAYLRRSLIETGFLEREHGVYRRVK